MKDENTNTELSRRMGNHPCAFLVSVIDILQ